LVGLPIDLSYTSTASYRFALGRSAHRLATRHKVTDDDATTATDATLYAYSIRATVSN